MLQGMAIGQLLSPAGGLTGMDIYQIVQYAPDVDVGAAAATMITTMMPDAKITNTSTTPYNLGGNAKFGVCTGWGAAELAADGLSYTSISFTGCSIPDGNGPLLTDAEILQTATNLKDSEDTGAKSYLLTADFLDGTSTAVSATKMRIFSGIPYNRDSFDVLYGLTSKTEDECKSYMDEREIGYLLRDIFVSFNLS